MVRTFSRGIEQIRLENRYDTQTAEFLVVIEHHDGSRETKRFAEALVFRAWLTAFEHQLTSDQWTPSGPIELSRRRLDGQAEPLMPAKMDADHGITAMTTRRYTGGARTFELLLSQRVRQDETVWRIERVLDVSWACRIAVIPGMQAITATTPDATFARACDCIDKWLWMKR
jgi:hypothetical protein